MDAKEYVSSIRLDSAAFAAAAQRDLEAAVPSCPGWTVADLVWHLTEVHAFWREVVVLKRTAPDDVPRPERPEPTDELLTMFHEGAEALANALAASDGSVAVWTWADQQDVAWVQRRMAHETAVHRWDVESATLRAPAPLPPALAVDGIAEFARFFAPYRPEGAPPPRPFRVVTTDEPAELVVPAVPVFGATELTPPSAAAAATLRGPASEVLLALWRRRPLSALEVEGDAALVAGEIGGFRED